MEQKEIRLNAGKRKSLTNDYRRHEETQHSQGKKISLTQERKQLKLSLLPLQL